MKKLIACFALASLLALGGTAIAAIGTVDDVPAATLLLPYFEVSLDDQAGINTLFSINNASAAPALVHVTVWSDLSIHVLDFDVYLTGYDVFTQSLYDLFVNGNSPLTEDVNDGDDISPVGDFSFPNVAYPNCDLPYSEPLLTALYVDHVQSSLTGQPSEVLLGGNCAGYDHEDRIARGYITMDVANYCDTAFPGDIGYFIDGGVGQAADDNVIWGDYFYVNTGENFAQGETLVHIEADPLLSIANYTFYYRFATNGADDREGLGSSFAVRYLDGGPFDGGTSLLVWRDGKRNIDPEEDGFNCNLQWPSPFPLGNHQVVIFDEDENPEIPETCQVSPCPPVDTLTPFPIEAQRTTVNGTEGFTLPTTSSFGWFYLNLNFGVSGPVQTSFIDTMQNWVTVVMDASGRYSVGYDAIQLDNVTTLGADVILPVN